MSISSTNYRTHSYRGWSISYPEVNNFSTRLKKTPYQTRFFYVLWGFTFTSLLAWYSLFRLRQSEKKAMLFLASFIALVSSGMLMVLSILYCWLGTATQTDQYYRGSADFVGQLGDFWGMFLLLGLVGYVCALILTFTVSFVPQGKTVFHNLRALLALFLILLPGLLGGVGGYLISSASIDLRHWYIYYILQTEEKPKLEAIYAQFSEDYQRLIEQHKIKLLSIPRPGESMHSNRMPQEQPIASYWRLAWILEQPWTLISSGDLENWNPPQQSMTRSRTMTGLFVWAMIILFGVPGLVFAILHIKRLKHETPRKGLWLASIAIFLYPVLITVAYIPLFIIVQIDMAVHNISSNDHFIFLFIAFIGAIGISAGIYFLRRHLRE